MGGLRIFAIVVLALLLLSLVRIGAVVEYSAQGLQVRARLGPFSLAVYPGKKGGKKRSKAPAKAEKAPDTKPGGTLKTLRALLPVVIDTAGRLRRKLRIDTLQLDYTAAGEADPASAAMAFGGANAAIGMIWPVFERYFDVRQRRIRTAVDFKRREPVVYLLARLTLSVGQAVALALYGAIHALRALSHVRREQNKQREAV